MFLPENPRFLKASAGFFFGFALIQLGKLTYLLFNPNQENRVDVIGQAVLYLIIAMALFDLAREKEQHEHARLPRM